jgi:mitogen-activated protein kinase kinase
LREWAIGLIERDNRKSHLAPQLSPASRDVLRGDDSPNASQTPTSGDIPIGGADVRSAITSPQYVENYNSSRSPTKNGSSVGRSGGAPFHPGLPTRGSTTNSVPKLTTLNAPDSHNANGSSSANALNFNNTTLPMRPAPAGPLPPPPHRKTEENIHKESRRQATFGNGLYGNGYAAGQ